VNFNENGGSSVSNITQNENTNVNQPNNPTKNNDIFDGWYKDANFTQAVVFPFQLTENLTLYAKWSNSRDYFLAARDATVNSDQFEYNFNLNVDTTFLGLDGPSAITAGNVKYNANVNNSFLKTENNSGLLLYDGTVYTVKTGSTLSTIKINEN